jgi:hypothetical protein
MIAWSGNRLLTRAALNLTPGISAAFGKDFTTQVLRVADEPQKTHLRDAAEGCGASLQRQKPLYGGSMMQMPIRGQGYPNIDIR